MGSKSEFTSFFLAHSLYQTMHLTVPLDDVIISQPQPGQHGAGEAGGQSADNSVSDEGNMWNDAEK